jgi:hypothetical protein
MKSNNNNNDDDDDDDDDDYNNNNNTAMGSVHARGDTFLTFGLKALTETNTSRLATAPYSSDTAMRCVIALTLTLTLTLGPKLRTTSLTRHLAGTYERGVILLLSAPNEHAVGIISVKRVAMSSSHNFNFPRKLQFLSTLLRIYWFFLHFSIQFI